LREAIVIYLYDYLTLSSEVELMWQGKLRFSTALYFTIRYLPVANLIWTVDPTILPQVSSCDHRQYIEANDVAICVYLYI
jgi:hypothetical protein